MPRAASDLLDCLADALQQLRVAVEREQHALEDLADVVKPRLEQRLGLDAFDLQLNLAEAGMRADPELEKLADVSDRRNARLEVVDLDVDLVDLDDGNVDQDVRTFGHVPRVENRVVGELLPLALSAPRGAATVGARPALVPRRLGGGVALDAPRLRAGSRPVVRGRRPAPAR